jgi:hypothetical protein
MRYNPGMNSRQKIIAVAAVFALLTFAPAGKAQGAGGQLQPPNAAGANPRTADIEHAVALLCPQKDLLRSKSGSISGCRTCPIGTDFRGDGSSQWEFRKATFGHFTSPTADNLLVDGFNCDSHASNFGGTYVFTFTSGRARLLKYAQGLHTEECKKFLYPDGREFLVCRGGWSGQGENVSYVYSAVFDAVGKDMQTMVFTTTDTCATCSEDGSVVVKESAVKDVRYATKDSGELTGFTITASLEKRKCSQFLSSADPKKAPALKPAKTYEIEFIFDGKQFHVAPQSKAIQALFEKD